MGSAFGGFAKGLTGSLQPMLEERRKKRAAEEEQSRQFWLNSIPHWDQLPPSVQAAGEKEMKSLYPDKESQGIIAKARAFAGRVSPALRKHGQQQQGQPATQIAPPSSGTPEDPSGMGDGAPAAAPKAVAPPMSRSQAMIAAGPAIRKAQEASAEAIDARKVEGQKTVLEDRYAGMQKIQEMKDATATLLKEMDVKMKKQQAEHLEQFRKQQMELGKAKLALAQKIAENKPTDPSNFRNFEAAYLAQGHTPEEAKKMAGDAIVNILNARIGGSVSGGTETVDENGNTIRSSFRRPNLAPVSPSIAGAKSQVQSKFTPTQESGGQAPIKPPVSAPPPPGSGRTEAQHQPTAKRQSDFDLSAWDYLLYRQFDVKGIGKLATREAEAIKQRSQQIMQDAGMTAGDVMALRAANKSDTAALAKLTGYDAMIRSFDETLKNNAVIAKKLSDAYKRTDYPFINSVIGAFKTGKGDPEAINLAGQLHGLASEWAKIVSGSTGARGADQEQMKKIESILSEKMSSGQLESYIRDVILPDAESRKTGNRKIMNEKLSAIRDGAGGGKAFNAPASPSAGVEETKEYQGHTYKRSKPGDPWKLVK